MSELSNADELRDEYDFTPEQLHASVRGKHANRYAMCQRRSPRSGCGKMFPDSESVNETLRALVHIIEKQKRRSA